MHSPLDRARPAPPLPRVADLQLRGRAGPVRTRVHWPPATDATVVRPLLVALPAAGADALWAALSASAGVVVLAVRDDARAAAAPDAVALDEAMTAAQWAADHADELQADARQLLVGGDGRGAWLAAAVALAARDDGWPSLVRQVLVVTAASDTTAGAALRGVPPWERSPAGVAPAIVVTIGDGAHRIDARRYAARLRRAGVRADEVDHDGPDERVAARLAPLLRRAFAVGAGGPA